MDSRGYEIFSSTGKKWKQGYDNKKDVRVLYNGWERWITTTGTDIKIGDGLKKTFQTVMGTWREDILQTLKMGERQDDEETWGLEGGYSSDRGLSRHSLDFHSGRLGENSSDESEGEQEEECWNSPKQVHTKCTLTKSGSTGTERKSCDESRRGTPYLLLTGPGSYV